MQPGKNESKLKKGKLAGTFENCTGNYSQAQN